MSEVPWTAMVALSGAEYSAVELSVDNDQIYMLEQRLLPTQETYLTLTTVAEVAAGIRDMVVRGAPAIGISAAYAMVLAAKKAIGQPASEYLATMKGAGQQLEATRPTAVNLRWALRRCLELAQQHADTAGQRRCSELADLARNIHREDVAACREMGRIGGGRLPDKGTVMTHCNTGALATGGYGTALGAIRGAIEAGKQIKVLANETRPYLQGARLTAWELQKDGIPVTVISDGMVGHCMSSGMVDAVVVGADRVARNGDIANKIGTYGVARLAQAHDIPFYVAVPWSTIDLETPSGAQIPIEQRGAEEITHIGGRQMVPTGVDVYHPAFDITPAELIAAIFTERGEFYPGQLASPRPTPV